MVAAFAALALARIPDAALHPRLWAEEGQVFYLRAAALPWYRALLMPYGGYLNLVANAAPVLARHLVRLEYVPWVTTAVGLLFQCCPAVILATARDAWLRPSVRAAALLLLATVPRAAETWLQTLHSQFHLTIACALILALDVPTKAAAWFSIATLMLAPLCGLAPVVLVPLFMMRAIIERTAGRLRQAAALSAAALCQIAFFYSHLPGRSYGVGPIMLLCIVYIKQIVLPFAGGAAAEQASAALRARIALHAFPWQPVLATCAGVCAYALALWRGRQGAAIWLFASACPLAWIGYFGAFADMNLLVVGQGEHYSYGPVALSSLSLLALAAGSLRPERWIARAGVVVLLAVGLLDWADVPAAVGRGSDAMMHGPRWRDEVAAWRRDPNHPIAIWRMFRMLAFNATSNRSPRIGTEPAATSSTTLPIICAILARGTPSRCASYTI
jgi:hypothetical protein